MQGWHIVYLPQGVSRKPPCGITKWCLQRQGISVHLRVQGGFYVNCGFCQNSQNSLRYSTWVSVGVCTLGIVYTPSGIQWILKLITYTVMVNSPSQLIMLYLTKQFS